MPPDGTLIPPDDPAPDARPIDHSRVLAILDVCMENAFASVQLAHARLMEPEAALPHAAPRNGPSTVAHYNSLMRTLLRTIALKTRLEYDQSTQTDSIAAERHRRAVRAAQHRRAGARNQVQRQLRIALETARATNRAPSLARLAGCTEENTLNDLLAKYTVPEIVAMICHDLDITLPEPPADPQPANVPPADVQPGPSPAPTADAAPTRSATTAPQAPRAVETADLPQPDAPRPALPP